MGKILYLGLDPSTSYPDESITHCPIIQTIPYVPENRDIQESMRCFNEYTHLIFTSKSAVHFFMDLAKHYGYKAAELQSKTYISVGPVTAAALQGYGMNSILTAKQETAEGVVELLDTLDLSNSYLFWPHSALSRPIITDYMKSRKVMWRDCEIYTTETRYPNPIPSLDEFEEIVFTSPSTVEAFIKIFGSLPSDKTLTAIGPVTHERLMKAVKGF